MTARNTPTNPSRLLSLDDEGPRWMPADNFIVKIYKSSFLLHFFKLLSFDIREPAHKDFFPVLEKKRGRAVNFFERSNIRPRIRGSSHIKQWEAPSKRSPPSFFLLLFSHYSGFRRGPYQPCLLVSVFSAPR